MDKNSTIGMLLIMGILLGYYVFLAPTPPTETAKITPDSLKKEEVIKKDTLAPQLSQAQKDSLDLLYAGEKYGEFGNLTKGEDKKLAIKTDLLSVNVRTKGGTIESAFLNQHQTYDSLPLPVVPASEKSYMYEEFTFNGKQVNTGDLIFTPVGEVPKAEGILTLRANLDANRYVEKTYTFKAGKYDVGYNFKMVGLQDALKNDFYTLKWQSQLARTEKAVAPQRQKTAIVYYTEGDDDNLSYSDKEQKDSIATPTNWVSFKSQFFSQIIVPEKPFTKASLLQVTPMTDSVMRVMHADLAVAAPKSKEISNNFMLFMGPNDYYLLKSYKKELEEQQDLGWPPVNYVNKVVMYLFKQVEKVVSNYGLIILIFAFLVKIVVLPLTYSSFVSMAKMRVLNGTPEMKELDEKYKDDAQKLQVEKMALNRKVGVSPFGGCVPMLLQYPILISMLYFFPQAIELRHKAFLWSNDLSSYDSIWDFGTTILGQDHLSLFTILMAASTFLFTYYQQQTQPQQMGGNNMMAQQMKIMMYIMPVFLIFFLNNYSSGLTWYYFVSNLLAIGQGQVIRLFVDDEKLLAQLHETKAKKKASGEKSRMEIWMEKQQEMQKKVEEERNKRGGKK
jgi:YidC/Oxa1 family membrane protein insertase